MLEILTATSTREAINLLTPKKSTPLHLALESGAIDCAEILLRKGADVNMLDSSGDTVLHKAALGGNAAIINLLISQWGAAFDRPNQRGELPIHYAALRGDHETIALLASLKANLEVATPAGNRPLHIAASSGHARAVYTLLSRGVDPQPSNRANESPLALAVKAGAPVCVKAILYHFFKRKISAPTSSSARCTTPLHLVAFNGNIECLVLLIRARFGALDAQDANGDTPLHLAVRHRNQLCAETLLRAGASPSVPNNAQQTPFDQAKATKHTGLINLFSLDLGIVGK